MLGAARLNSALVLGDPAAEAYIAAAGITDPARQEAIRAFYAASRVQRPKLDYLFFFAGPARAAALVNVCNPAFSATEQSAPGYWYDFGDGPEWVPPQPPIFDADRGYRGVAGEFGIAGYIIVPDPFLPGANLTNVSASLGVYTNMGGSSRSAWGAGLGAWNRNDGHLQVDYQVANGFQVNVADLRSGGGGLTASLRPPNYPDGHLSVHRDGTASGIAWNGAGGVSGSTAPVTMWGGAPQNPLRFASEHEVRVAAAYAGGYLNEDDRAALDAALHAYLSTFGAQAARP